MALWLELAGQARAGSLPAPILDVGAGTGRVALALAEDGHAVTALDSEQVLLDELSRRARLASLEVSCVRGDARELKLAEHGYALCAIPMQTIQLLGGPAGRTQFLRGAHAHLREGALLACAIVTELESFDVREGVTGPEPEQATVGDAHYSSQAKSVQLRDECIRIERLRRIVWEDGRPPSTEIDVIELDRLTARELQGEGRTVGLGVHDVREIPPTDEHVGSEVVIFRA